MSIVSMRNGEKSYGAGGEVGNETGGTLAKVQCTLKLKKK